MSYNSNTNKKPEPSYSLEKISEIYFRLTGQPVLSTDSALDIFRKIINFYTQIIERLPGHIYWLDLENKFLGCNQTQAKNVGLASPQEIIGRTIDSFMSKDLAKTLEDINNKVIAEKKGIIIEEFGTNLEYPQGGFYLSEKVPIFDQGNEDVIGILGVSIDITPRKKAEEGLKSVNALKTEFIQNMQHDIRTPSAGLWSLLAHLAATETNEERRELLLLGQNSAKQLLDLCNEIIDFDQIERGHQAVISKKFDLHGLIKSVVALNFAAAHAKHIPLIIENLEAIPGVVKSDEHRVKRILINLLGNALKFTQQGEIRIVTKVVKETEKQVIIEFEIRDTGVGIPFEKKEQIYEKFIRLDPSNRAQYSGSGLGLQIVKQFVSELEGEIEVQSELGKGTRFFVSLPFEKPLNTKIHSDSVSPTKALGLMNSSVKHTVSAFNDSPQVNTSSNSQEQAFSRVLLIEDQLLAAKMGVVILEGQGYAVTHTLNVKDSLHRLAEKKFDWVLSDLGLPDGTGCDIVRAIKADPTHLNFKTPFFAITAHDDDQKRQEALAAGFLKLYAKPLTSDITHHLIKMTA